MSDVFTIKTVLILSFGSFVELNKMDSNGVREHYNDLKFTASEVVEDVLVQLKNSSEISIKTLDNIRYMLPLYEMGDCPVFKVPDGFGSTSRIT